MSDHGHGHGDEYHVHIVPPSVYIKNGLFLTFMMFLTVAASLHHFGPEGSQALNLTIAMAIAGCKMIAIMAFFMHVKYSSSLVKVFAGIAFAFMVIFFAFTFADFVARNNHYHSTFVSDPYGGTPTGAATR